MVALPRVFVHFETIRTVGNRPTNRYRSYVLTPLLSAAWDSRARIRGAGSSQHSLQRARVGTPTRSVAAVLDSAVSIHFPTSCPSQPWLLLQAESVGADD